LYFRFSTKFKTRLFYVHTDHCLNSSIVIRCLDRPQPNEIRPLPFGVPDASANANSDAVAKNSARADSTTNSGAKSFAATSNNTDSNETSASAESNTDAASAETNAGTENRADANSVANTDPENNGGANAAGNSAATASNVSSESYTRAASAESVAYVRTDRRQTDAYPCAASRRQSLPRSPGRELQRQKIPPHGERKGYRAYAVSRLGSKEYRRRQHLNVYRYEER
jgi:hypothetical protein